MQINDGTGKGYAAAVDAENRLKVKALTEVVSHVVSEDDGQMYSWSSVTYDYDAADTVLWLRNDSTTLDLFICGVALWSDTATAVTMHFPTGTTAAGTAVTGTNFNRTSGNVAEATSKADETGNSQGTIGGVFHVPAGLSHTMVCLDGTIILGLNDEIGFDFVTNGAAANVTIFGYFYTG